MWKIKSRVMNYELNITKAEILYRKTLFIRAQTSMNLNTLANYTINRQYLPFPC